MYNVAALAMVPYSLNIMPRLHALPQKEFARLRPVARYGATCRIGICQKNFQEQICTLQIGIPHIRNKNDERREAHPSAM